MNTLSKNGLGCHTSIGYPGGGGAFPICVCNHILTTLYNSATQTVHPVWPVFYALFLLGPSSLPRSTTAESFTINDHVNVFLIYSY